MLERTCVIAALLLAGAGAPIQAEDDWSVYWNNGTRVESEDGRFKLKFGGRIQADATFVVSQEDALEERVGTLLDGTEFRRARLFFEGTLYDNVAFKAQFDFATGDVVFRDVWIAFRGTPVGEVKIGHFKEPFSLEEMTSSRFITFLERSLPILFAPSRNVGLLLSGNPGDKLHWAAGVFRETDNQGRSLGEDLMNVTGRFVYRPVYKDDGRRFLHLGLSATDKQSAGLNDEFRLRQRAEVHFGPPVLDTGSFATDGETILDIEIAGVRGPLWLAAEYLHPSVGTPDRGTLEFPGYYIQGGYFLTGETRSYKVSTAAWDRVRPLRNWGDGGKGAWEVAARLSSTDLSDALIVGGKVDGLTLALNWYPNPATRLMFNYVMSEIEGIGGADFILFRAQVDF